MPDNATAHRLQPVHTERVAGGMTPQRKAHRMGQENIMQAKHETFEQKRKKMEVTAIEDIARLDKQRDLYIKLAYDILAASTYMERVQEMYDFLVFAATEMCDLAGEPIENKPRSVNWTTVYASTPYGESKQVINVAVDYEVEKISDVEGVIAALEHQNPEWEWEWKTSDNSYGRIFTALLPFATDFNVRLEISACPSSSNEEKCFRVIEKAEAVTTEVKTYRWICK